MKMNQLAICIFILMYFSACKPDYRGQNVGVWREKVSNNTSDTIQIHFTTVKSCSETIPDSVKIAPNSESLIAKAMIYYDMSGMVYEIYNTPCAPDWKFIDAVKKGGKSYKKEALENALHRLVISDKMPNQMHDYVWIFEEENFE